MELNFVTIQTLVRFLCSSLMLFRFAALLFRILYVRVLNFLIIIFFTLLSSLLHRCLTNLLCGAQDWLCRRSRDLVVHHSANVVWPCATFPNIARFPTLIDFERIREIWRDMTKLTQHVNLRVCIYIYIFQPSFLFMHQYIFHFVSLFFFFLSDHISCRLMSIRCFEIIQLFD